MIKMARRATARAGIAVVLAAGVGLPLSSAQAAVLPTWLHAGSTTQYPSTGGTWEYGFWNAHVRSYYTVNRCHGSSVRYNGSLLRSADTASGQKSIAEKWGLNYWSASDAYYYRVC
jgi:lactococcin 972-like bacteriocin